MKYLFTKEGINLIITLDTESGKYAPQISALNDPNITLENNFIWFYENGKHFRYLSFLEIGTIGGVVPTNIANAYSLLNTMIDTLNPATVSNFLNRPVNGIVNFQVPVNCANQNVSVVTLANQDTINIQNDWGILLLPTNYTATGLPIRLVIACHGSGTWINSSSTGTMHSQWLLSQGFAVLDMNGIPQVFAGSTGTDNNKRHYGAPFALDSYINGYRYAIEKYNISNDGCFVYGISMGGLSSFMLSQSNSIPVIAQGAFCPCIDLYKQAYSRPWSGASQRQDIATYFGFTGTAPTFTTTVPPTQSEVDYFIANIDKIVGYDNMLKNVPNAIRTDIYAQNGSAVTTTTNASEDVLYQNLSKIHPIPLKIWHNTDDTIVLYRYSKYYANMIRNAGGTAFLRSFPSGGHNAWLNGDVVANVPTIDSSTISMQASIYELIQWFKRFDR